MTAMPGVADLLDAIPEFARCNRLKKGDLKVDSADQTVTEGPYEDADLFDANLISSEVVEGVHIPLIDIDLNAALVPSSTHGNSHLYINKAMPFEDLVKLLEVMVEVGIVQEGFLNGTKARGSATLRLPHINKYREGKMEVP